MRVDRRWRDVAAVSTSTQYGSARLFAPNMLVTAAHVVNGLGADELVTVQILSDRKADGSWPAGRKAKLVWRGMPSVDMALLELIDQDPPIIPEMETGFAGLDAIDEVRTLAIGFPEGWLAGGALRPYPVFGQLRPADVGGGYLWTVEAADKPDHVTQWSGLSGTSLVISLGQDRLFLFGVIEEVPANFSGGMLKVVDFFAPQRLAGFSQLTAATKTYAWQNGAPSLRIVVGADGTDEEDAPPPRYRANWEPLIDEVLAVREDQALTLEITLDHAALDAMLDEAERNLRNIKHRYASIANLVADVSRSHDSGKAITSRITADVNALIEYLRNSYLDRHSWGAALDGFVSLMMNYAFSSFYRGFFNGDKSRRAVVARTLGVSRDDMESIHLWERASGPIRVLVPLSCLNGVRGLARVGTILSKGVENPDPALTALRSSIKEWDYLFEREEQAEFWTRFVVPQAFAFGYRNNLPKTPFATLSIGLA